MPSRHLYTAICLVSLLAFPASSTFRQTNPFTSFNLELNTSGSVYIYWKTTAGLKNVRFEVEKSTDQKYWQTIESTPSQLTTQFTYIDIKPARGNNYYRIKMIDEKEECFFSSVRSIQLADQSECRIWPQPASEVLHIDIPFSYATLEIIDASGRTSQKRSVTASRTEISIKEIPAGIYFIRIKYANKVWLQKFIRQ
jgi:hypothetical protein